MLAILIAPNTKSQHGAEPARQLANRCLRRGPFSSEANKVTGRPSCICPTDANKAPHCSDVRGGWGESARKGILAYGKHARESHGSAD
eukprot:8366574-Pyramimonas_sp.AAC.1